MAEPLIDVGQWLSFISGYRRTTKIPKTSQAKLNEFLKAAQSDLRDVIESATPAMFLFDSLVYISACLEFAKDLKVKDSTSWLYVNAVEDSSGNRIYRDDSNFYMELVSAVNRYRVPRSQLRKTNLIPGITTRYNSLSDFANPVRSTLQLLNADIEKNISQISTPGPQQSAAIGRARSRTIAAGRKLRSEFAKLTPCALKNPENIVVGFNTNYQEILLGSTFANLKDRVNSIITPIVIESFRKAGIILSTENKKSSISSDRQLKFTIGSIVVFGHTGAKTTQDGLAVLLGLNTPWTQQLLLLAAEKGVTGKAVSVLDGFANTSGQLDLSVEFTKTVSDDISVLMRGQLAIIVPITSRYNSEILKQEEIAAENLIQEIFGKGSTYRKVRGSLIERILSVASINRLVKGLRFSPTLAESIKEGLVSTLQSGKFKKTVAKSKKETFNIVKESLTRSSNAKTSVTKKSLPKAYSKSKQQVLPNVARTQTNVIDLQSLLNRSLHDQIKKNMGTGNRRDVLNYRTGRFAESVKVERISESRQGMITAFYSYMKNPYATFSQGGRQQYPRTRDPKTLISKSIREIAQTMVTNQLRAVNV